MPVRVRYYTDPASAESWAAEPAVRELMVEFGPDLSFQFVMGGLAREYETPPLVSWLAAADHSGMPVDPLIWRDGPIASSYPACMAVKAAAEQAEDGGYRYLRALREGLFCLRRKLDTTEALVEEARSAGLDVERFRIDLASNAIVEAFGNDLEATRAIPEVARSAGAVVEAGGGERLPFPTLAFDGDDRETQWVFGLQRYSDYREAAKAAGAAPLNESRPSVARALERFGRLAAAEAAAVCEVPPARAQLELWDLASEWRARPIAVLASHLFEAT
jgi:predicted DsbA family dithiol-disulfide isomerase